MLFYLAFKNIVSRKSSAVIIMFISFALMLMTVINSIFDSTEHGVEKVYSKSFTGDFVIRPKSNAPLSLFGDETPMLGKMTELPNLVPYIDLKNYLVDENLNPEIKNITPQVTCLCAMEINDDKSYVNLFGVPCDSYLKLMSAIEIVEGTSFGDDSRGVLLPKKIADKYNVKVSDSVQFIVTNGMTIRIRAADVKGIFTYPIDSDTLDRIVLADSYTVRSLMGVTGAINASEVVSEEKFDLLDEDIESMFDFAEDVDAIFVDEDEFMGGGKENIEELTVADFSESSTWNFIIGNVHDEKQTNKAIRKLNRYFKKQSWPLEAVYWRSAAGSKAMYLYVLRIIFNAGVIIILLAGFIIINNTLVVGVLNRTQEIGTLRAEGASRNYISMQCMIETFLLTITSGIIGCILGAVISKFISMAEIQIQNSFLIQLFGSDVLLVFTSTSVLLRSMILSVILGLIGWIYPVRTALKVTPVQAMQGGAL